MHTKLNTVLALLDCLCGPERVFKVFGVMLKMFGVFLISFCIFFFNFYYFCNAELIKLTKSNAELSY